MLSAAKTGAVAEFADQHQRGVIADPLAFCQGFGFWVFTSQILKPLVLNRVSCSRGDGMYAKRRDLIQPDEPSQSWLSKRSVLLRSNTMARSR